MVKQFFDRFRFADLKIHSEAIEMFPVSPGKHSLYLHTKIPHAQF